MRIMIKTFIIDKRSHVGSCLVFHSYVVALVKYMKDHIEFLIKLHLERRIFFCFILKDEIESLRSESLIMLFRTCSLFARILLPILHLFVFTIENLSCLEVSNCWKFKAIHSISGDF